MPSVGKLPQAQAVRELNKVGLKVNIDEENSDTVRDGFAIRTVPREGTLVTRNTREAVRQRRPVEGRGAKRGRSVPRVGRAAARQRRPRGGGERGGIDQRENEVLSQIPAAGSRVDKGTRVTITVSTGRPKVDVPDVAGSRRRLRPPSCDAPVSTP